VDALELLLMLCFGCGGAVMAVYGRDAAAHWRMRVEELRCMMEDALSEEAKAIMLRIAKDYDRLARLAEDAAAYDSLMVPAAADHDQLLGVSKNDGPT
jgi:hypothetical protein